MMIFRRNRQPGFNGTKNETHTIGKERNGHTEKKGERKERTGKETKGQERTNHTKYTITGEWEREQIGTTETGGADGNIVSRREEPLAKNLQTGRT